MAIQRHFVTIGERQVHYRRAGDGPALLMLHASLNTSATFLPLIPDLAKDFTVIAMDTPGYGLSDCLSDQPPEVEDYSDGVIEFMDALGLKRVALYGMLTGTMIGLDLGSRYPERFSAVILNTMLVHSKAELKDFLDRFTPPYELRIDGAHLVQAWALMRRNAIAYPWFSPNPNTRFDLPLPPPDELHLRLMNCLSAGAEYSWGAKAAFRFLLRANTGASRVPTVFFSDRSQPFGEHAKRLEPLPEQSSVYWFDNWGDLPRHISKVIKKMPAADVPGPIPPATGMDARMSSQCVAIGDMQLHLRCCLEGEGVPVLLIHGAGASAQVIQHYSQSILGRRPVLAVDWAGHGESSGWPNTKGDPSAFIADCFAAVLDQLKLERVDLFAAECGAVPAFELARRAPQRIESIAWAEVLLPPLRVLPLYRHRYAPDVEPDASGSYLLRAWAFVRDRELYWPWFETSQAGIIWAPRFASLERQQDRVLALLKATSAVGEVYDIAFDSRWRALLSASPVPARVCTYVADPREAHVTAAAELLGTEPITLGTDETCWIEEAL